MNSTFKSSLGRPCGDVRLALREAWSKGPAPVSVAAGRACVGLSVARYTASRMVGAGELAVVQSGKPAVLGLPIAAQGAQTPADVVSVVEALASFWSEPDADDGCGDV